MYDIFFRGESGSPLHKGGIMDESVCKLVRRLSLIANEDLPVEILGDTYEVEADSLTLTFTLDDEFLEILSINVHGNIGLGRKVVHAVHAHADQEGLEVIARNVCDHARGFWEKMGYVEGQTHNEFFRIA